MQITFKHFMQSYFYLLSYVCVIGKRPPKSACSKLRNWPLIKDSLLIFLGAKILKSYTFTYMMLFLKFLIIKSEWLILLFFIP